MTAPNPERPDLTRDQFTNDESYYLATGRMVATTPERYRALADRIETGDDHGVSLKPDAISALRAAADRIQYLEDMIR